MDDYIKFENFDTDIHKIYKKLGFSLNVEWNTNYTKKHTYIEYYNDETINIVYDLYKKDIEEKIMKDDDRIF